MKELTFFEAMAALHDGYTVSTDYGIMCPTRGLQKINIPISKLIKRSDGVSNLDYTNVTENHDGKIFFKLKYSSSGKSTLIQISPFRIDENNSIRYMSTSGRSDINQLIDMKFIKYENNEEDSILDGKIDLVCY